jgi:hypothetical protein
MVAPLGWVQITSLLLPRLSVSSLSDKEKAALFARLVEILFFLGA